ncbi:uncharacterized protein ACBT57_019875 isoform 2-T2 [Dama dama]
MLQVRLRNSESLQQEPGRYTSVRNLPEGKHQRESELQHEGRPPGSGPEPRLQERRLSQGSAEASPQRPAGSRRRARAGRLDFHPSSCCLFPPSTAIRPQKCRHLCW